jgi:arabinosaccharide transport system substrate-binding protein
MMKRMLTRRDFLKVTGAGLAGTAVFGVAGCGGGGQGGDGNTLEFWFFSQERAGWVRKVLGSEAWTSAHPDAKVNIRVFPYEQMHDKLLSALVSGKGAPDLADVEISRFSAFIRGDRVPFMALEERIGDEIDNVYKSAATDPWSWEGKIYGLGNELNTAVLTYRQDVMDQVGARTPFESWDEVIEAGKEVSQGDRKMFALHDQAFGDHYMLTQSAGSTYFDAQGNYIADNEKSVEALQFLHDLVYEHKIAGIAPATEADNWYPPPYRAAFRAGKYVAFFGPPWHLAFLPLDVPDQSGKWAVQKLPKGLGESVPTASFGGTGQCITEQAGNPDLAWELIRTCNLTVEGVLADFKLRTIYPTYRPAYEVEALNQPYEYFSNVKIGPLYASLAPEIVPFNQSPVWAEATETLIREAISPVLRDEAEAKSALSQAGSEIRET